jgi:trafficking protein particle complex subunit 5
MTNVPPPHPPPPSETRLTHADMVHDNAPMITKFISVPQSMSQLNCSAFLAGIIEAILDSTMFFTQRVTAHSTGDETVPQRCTILIKFQREVIEREALLK